jgi:hypothetical protein
MVTRKPAAAFLVLALGILGCSKTQDTAPETRIFGDPPAIGGVTLNATTKQITCDITVAIQGAFCQAGNLARNLYRFSPGPAITVDIGYTEFEFLVQVTDPQSTSAQSDILLVSASFQTPAGQGQAEETSLLLLDDGGELEFPWRQTQTPLDNCSFNSSLSPPCICSPGNYPLTTNDATKADNTFTRGFGFIAPSATIPVNGFGIVESCLARVQHQAPFSATAFIDKDVSFKIEATDRAGSITEWPERPVGHVDPTTWNCAGDLCACCVATTSDPTECSGLPGLISLSDAAGWPTGTGLCAFL